MVLAASLAAVPYHTALSATAPPLGAAQSFAVLGATTVNNTGLTGITGDLGVNPGATIIGFPPGTLTAGTMHAADALSLQAQSDTTTAYNNLAGQACNSDLTGQDLGGMALLPGVYCYSTAAQLTGTLTLNAGGDVNAVWVFKTGSTLTTAINSSVQLINAGQQSNVFWQVGSSATIGAGTLFIGNILANTSITLNSGANVSGRVLARNGAVTMDSNNVTLPPLPAPTATKSFTPDLIGIGGVATLNITLTNPNTIDIIGVAFSDIFTASPAQIVIAPTPNLSNSCGGTVSTPGNNSLTLSGGTIPHSASCTVKVDISTSVSGNYVNNSGIITAANAADGTSAAANLTVIVPALTVLKSADTATASLGQEITYTVKILNPNPFSVNSVTAMDSMSNYTAWKLNSFQLINGSPVSGLTLGSGIFSYSSNNGSTWTYLPVSGGGGQPAGYDGLVTNWKVAMDPSEAINGNNASFSIKYTVRAK